MTTFPIAFEFQNFVLDCCGALSAMCFSAGAAKALGSWQPLCHHEVKIGCEWILYRRQRWRRERTSLSHSAIDLSQGELSFWPK